MNEMAKLFGEFADWIEHLEASNPAVSKWSVGMHVQHCLLSGIGI